jgi:hypothetical protein
MSFSTTASATHASARSRCRWRSDRIAAQLLLALGCSASSPDPRSHVDREPIDAAVVAELAARGELDEARARAEVVATLQLVAAARAERSDPDAAELTDERSAQLRRTSLARLSLREEFEATHRVVDIPADDPMLAQARGQPRYVHPRLHDVCQLVVGPTDVGAEQVAVHTADLAWRARAHALLADIDRHVRAVIPADDPKACELLTRDLVFERRSDDGIEVKYERARFDLDACAVELDSDGRCAEPRFAPEWVELVRTGEVPGWRGPFWTRFGLHLALVQEVLPANLPGDDGFEQRLRESIHRDWQSAELLRWLAGLRTEYAAQLVVSEDGAR